jgi:hypothetical protein
VDENKGRVIIVCVIVGCITIASIVSSICQLYK